MNISHNRETSPGLFPGLKALLLGLTLSRLPDPSRIRKTWAYRRLGNKLLLPELWNPTRESLALGIAIGWFLGLSPLYGLHMVLAILLGAYFRAHVPAAVLGTFITNPITAPGILLVQFRFGMDLAEWVPIKIPQALAGCPDFLQNGFHFAVGSICSAVLIAALGYCSTWLLWPHLLAKNAGI